MLEILVMAIIYGALAPVVKKKNRSKWLPLLGPGFWLAGKFIVSFVASVVCAVLETASDDSEMIIYASALLGGILGAAIAFLIIKLLPIKTLTCPQCNHQFVNNSQWGVTCENCKTKLKVSNDQVTIQERA